MSSCVPAVQDIQLLRSCRIVATIDASLEGEDNFGEAA